MGAAGQAVAAAHTGAGIALLPPVAGSADQVVALLGEGLHAVAHGQVAQPQQLRDRNSAGAGQAGPALAAALGAQAGLAGGAQALQGLPVRITQPGQGAADGRGPGQVARLGGPQAQGGDPLIEQEAIGQFEGVERSAVGQQLGRRVVEAATLVGRGDRQHADAAGQGGAGQRQAGLIEQMHMQAAEAEAPGGQGLLDQGGIAMAGEAHLAHQTLAEGPAQQFGAGAMQGPGQMVGPVQAMHGQVVEPGDAQPLQDRPQLLLGGGQLGAGQQLAGEHQLGAALRVRRRQRPQGLTQIGLGRAVGGGCFDMADAGRQGCLQHRRHLLRALDGPHRAQAEGRHGPAAAEAVQTRRSGAERWAGVSQGAFPPGCRDQPRCRRRAQRLVRRLVRRPLRRPRLALQDGLSRSGAPVPPD